MLYEITLFQNYFNQNCVNRWNYLSTGTPAAVMGSFALLVAFGFLNPEAPPTYVDGTPFETIRQMQNGSVTYLEADIRAVYDNADFYTLPFITNNVGIGSAGEPLAPFVSAGFRTNRVLQNIARGTKRFVGVSETMVGPGGVWESSWLANWTQVAEAMSDTLTYDDEGNTITFTPCVVQKEKYTTSSGKDAYRYYDTLAHQTPHIASGVDWQLYPNVRSQVSRQYGRGS